MKHAVNSRTRLKGGVSRFFTRMFNSGDPHGWGDYHIVPESGDTLWVHTHGLDNFGLLNLEFEGVPADLRDDAVRLMLALVKHGRIEQHLEIDGDFSGFLSADAPGFRQAGTLRSTNHGDAEHRDLVRIVDLGEPMGASFPARLFASHLVARAVETSSAKRREHLCRRALEIFPGAPAPQDMKIDVVGGEPDMTALQQIANLGARMGLAGALLERDERDEGLQVLEDAIAYCPGWARDHKRQAADGGNDFHARFWADADIDEISRRRRPASGSPAAQPSEQKRPGGGFGNRPGFGNRALGAGS